MKSFPVRKENRPLRCGRCFQCGGWRAGGVATSGVCATAREHVGGVVVCSEVVLVAQFLREENASLLTNMKCLDAGLVTGWKSSTAGSGGSAGRPSPTRPIGACRKIRCACVWQVCWPLWSGNGPVSTVGWAAWGTSAFPMRSGCPKPSAQLLEQPSNYPFL